VTDSVHSDALTPPIADSYGWMLTGDAVIEERSPGSPAVVRTGRTPLLIAPLERTAPMPGGSEGHGRTGVSWRCDGR
jgi:hypothetical protein